MPISFRKGNTSTESLIMAVRSHPFRPNVSSFGLKEWDWCLDFWEVKKAVPVPGCALQHSDFHMLYRFACLTFYPTKPLPGCYSVLSPQTSCRSCQRKKINKRNPLCSKNNMCLKGLKYNFYLQKSVFMTAFLPSSTTCYCCFCLNSVLELHLWQLSKSWKKAASGSTNPFCCSRS